VEHQAAAALNARRLFVSVELWTGGPVFSDIGAFPLTADSVILADFAEGSGELRGRALDIGCGSGIIALRLAWDNPQLCVDGVEIAPIAAETARENMRRNGLSDRVTITTADAREPTAFKSGAYTLVVANPPYFSPKRGKSGGAERAELTLTLRELCRAASRALADGGRFALVYRVERLAELFSELRDARLEPKRLRFVQHDAAIAPNIALVEARRGGQPGLDVQIPLLLREDGGDSREIRRIYRNEH
jgi:tRNA1Val (adenine37-N6)-methyltransferase